MIHEILPVGPLQCNCSVIGDETTGDAIVIDTSELDLTEVFERMIGKITERKASSA